MSELEGRTAIVSGGTKGIGRAVTEELLDAGFRVVFSARTVADVEGVTKKLGKRGEVLGVVADVRDPKACSTLPTSNRCPGCPAG